MQESSSGSQLQRHGGHYVDRRLFVVHLLHGPETGLNAIADVAGATDTRRPAA